MALNRKKLETISYNGFNVQELELAQRNLYSIVIALERKDYRVAAADIMARCDRFAKNV